jgi:hypothetical protein
MVIRYSPVKLIRIINKNTRDITRPELLCNHGIMELWNTGMLVFKKGFYPIFNFVVLPSAEQ